MRKGAGITFSNNQLRDLASKIAGKPFTQNISALSRLHRTLERNGVGLLFSHIFLPDGMDDDKEEDDKRRWMLVLRVKALEPGETVYKFSDIPFDQTDETVAKGLRWLVGFGYPEDDVKGRWATFSSWSFRESVFTTFN